ncbi:hypothetical protein ACLK1T_17775 [Escherichia coli]
MNAGDEAPGLALAQVMFRAQLNEQDLPLSLTRSRHCTGKAISMGWRRR